MPASTIRYSRVALDGQPTFVAVGAECSARVLGAAPWLGGVATGQALAPSELARLDPLCPVQPSKIIGIGRNYKKHAEELKNELPEEPLMFLKPPSSLLDPGGVVLLPPESSRVDYEGELALVIGRRARRIAVAEAWQAIFGYSIACDVTARDLQTKDKQWARAKGFDTFCPIGPSVVPLEPPRLARGGLRLELALNGTPRQDARTSDMIFDIPTLVAYASNAFTLEPGDVILTGTPEGVGPLTDGDAVSVRIESLGELTFRVAAEQR
jgi:2-keto-4-pentenoate hydratase/2-oxohepta-3-ene-1,7-dioic acid hydratase in catechol pathway